MTTLQPRGVGRAALMLIAALATWPAAAANVAISDATLTTRASATAQGEPNRNDFDAKTAPVSSLLEAEALVHANGIPFPNLPNSQGQAFASSAVDAAGHFGVGVNGFFFPNALPPNALQASGSYALTFTDAAGAGDPGRAVVSVDLEVPAPTILFFGVGNSFPPGVDPARDATASVSVKLLTRVTHADGSVDSDVALDYGMTVVREPVSGVLLALPSGDALGALTRFDQPDGSFGFELPALVKVGFVLGDMGPGDVFDLDYEFLAQASTGFGETGIFAAIGDPFGLSVDGGRIDVQFTVVTAAVPEPGSAMLLGAGLLALLPLVRARRARAR